MSKCGTWESALHQGVAVVAVPRSVRVPGRYDGPTMQQRAGPTRSRPSPGLGLSDCWLDAGDFRRLWILIQLL